MKNLLTNCYTVLVVISFAIASCKHSNQESQTGSGVMLTSTYYQPSKLIDSLTKIFLDSAKCKDCLNEVYIDKVYEDEIYLTFKAKKYYKEYFIKNKPLFYFSMNEKKIFVYTGAENFILGNQKNTDTLRLIDNSKESYYLLMEFLLTKDSVKLVSVPTFPFTPQMNQFVPTEDNIPKFDSKKDYSH